MKIIIQVDWFFIIIHWNDWFSLQPTNIDLNIIVISVNLIEIDKPSKIMVIHNSSCIDSTSSQPLSGGTSRAQCSRSAYAHAWSRAWIGFPFPPPKSPMLKPKCSLPFQFLVMYSAICAWYGVAGEVPDFTRGGELREIDFVKTIRWPEGRTSKLLQKRVQFSSSDRKARRFKTNRSKHSMCLITL